MLDENALERFFEKVSLAQRATLGAPTGPIGGALEVLLCAPGKLLRPRLVGLLALDLGVSLDDVVPLAVAAELVHGGSLVHDDVIDHGDERRGQPALHIVKGAHVAVLTGDYLLAKAMTAVSAGPSYWTQQAAWTLAEMSTAAALEVQARDANAPSPLEVWTRIAEGKTGALFAFCLSGVAHLAGADASEAVRLGVESGVLYQWLDDLLDFVPRTKKRRFADLYEHNPNRVVCSAELHIPAVKNDNEARAVSTRLQSQRQAQTELFLERRRVLVQDLDALGYKRVAAAFDAATDMSVALLSAHEEAA